MADAQASASRAPVTGNGFVTPALAFAGIDWNFTHPPDPVGAVGPRHYVQAANRNSPVGTQIAVFDKSGNAVASFRLGDLAPPSALSCGKNDLGDPIVLYDHLAHRWFLSEFTSSGRLCIYLSQSSDPLGSYLLYELTPPGFEFPDYPKYAVWPDGYYLGTNESDPAIYVLDRAAMLAGEPASYQRFLAPQLDAWLGGSSFLFEMLLPAGVQGRALPLENAPAIFARHRDDEAHDVSPDPTRDYLELFELSVNWDDPESTTLTGPFQIPIAEFDSDLCGLLTFSCVPQPIGADLDPLREPLLFPFHYRNFGDHESLIGNFVTDVTGDDYTGTRWFELRRSPVGSGSWSVFQEGTWSLPDGDHRWMASIAADRLGNLAMVYNASGTATYPSLRFTGRLASHVPSIMTFPEVEVATGADANTSNRYGDYSSISVDPQNDCTFWMTGEYNPAAAWSTWIVASTFDQCGWIFDDGFESGDTLSWTAEQP